MSFCSDENMNTNDFGHERREIVIKSSRAVQENASSMNRTKNRRGKNQRLPIEWISSRKYQSISMTNITGQFNF